MAMEVPRIFLRSSLDEKTRGYFPLRRGWDCETAWSDTLCPSYVDRSTVVVVVVVVAVAVAVVVVAVAVVVVVVVF